MSLAKTGAPLDEKDEMKSISRPPIAARAKPGPFEVSALDYFDVGLFPMPIRVEPPHNKRPILKGWAPGRDNPYPDRARVEEWVRRYPRAAIGLRVPRTVLGIDIDAHDGKAGRATLRALVQEIGEPLPGTWISTSREDWLSGIALYRVVDNDPFRDPGEGVELIRWCHRFIMCAPSHHPREGRPRYFWIRPDGTRADDEIPAVTDLPVLPARWAERLPKGSGVVRSRLTAPIAPTAWLQAANDASGAPCAHLRATYRMHRDRVRTAEDHGGAHPAMRAGVWALIGDMVDGHTGGGRALEKLGREYVHATRTRRAAGVAAHEFAGALRGAVDKTPARFDAVCVCTDPLWGLLP